MAFNVGTLVATIQLGGKSKFDSDLASAGQGFVRTSSLADKMGKAAGDAFRGASIAAGVATAAATAYVTSLFRTGVAYNTLQQQSRAALTTILGGTQQANAQMDKLDAFAKTSPFAKSVFITAQQQLLGFGLQAQKVIPALTAIQDAVAAVGGGNDQISQITYALAQMMGQGKLTGETLNQLGQYGIDAASLVGKQMGKTGQEIRDMASSPGGIPVDQVWDPLITALEDRFAGAAANVKGTWSGTTDRIKAASRDIGSALAAPFVDPHGGGMAITWGNDVADIMRAVQAKVTPVLSLLTGRAQPVFQNITGWLEKAKDAVNGWDTQSLITTFDKAAHYAPALGGIGGAVAAMNLGLLKSIPVLGKFVPAVNPVVAAIGGIVLSSPEARDAITELLKAFQPLIPVAANLAKVLAGDLTAAMPGVSAGVTGIANVLTPFIDLIAKIPTPLLLAAGAFVAFEKVRQPFASGILDAGVKVEGFLGKLGGVGGKFGSLVNGFQNVAGFLAGPWGLAVGGAAALLSGIFLDNMAAAKKKVDDYTDSLDENTGAITDNTRATALQALQDSGAIKAAKAVGVSPKMAVDAALGDKAASDLIEKNYKAAYAKFLNPPKGLTAEQVKNLQDQATAWSTLEHNVGRESAAVKDSVTADAEKLNALGKSKKAHDDVTTSLKSYDDTVKENNASIKQNNDAVKAGTLSAADAQKMNAQATKESQTALDALAAKAKDYITTVHNQTLSTVETQRAQGDMAASLVASAEKMGMSQQAAIDYTAKILGIPASRVTETAVTGVGKAAADAKTVKDAINAVPSNKNTKVTIDAYGAFATLDELNAYLIQLGNKEIALGGKGKGAAGYYGFANGSILEFFAQGGVRAPERHVAQIAPAGAWRVWAEPETQGEAYIPFAASKRARSLDIWQEAGRRLGVLPFASGGITVGSARATAIGSMGSPVSAPSVHVAPANVQVIVTPKVGGIRIEDLIDIRVQQANDERALTARRR